MRREHWHRAGLASLGLFVAITALQHALAPQLAPSRHEISEYVHAGTGWLMVIGFVAWSASLAIAAGVAWRDLGARQRPDRALRVLTTLLVAAAAGMLVTACFSTQTSAGVLPPGVRLTARGRLHDLGSGVATLALLGAAVASALVIEARAFRRWVAVMLATSVASSAVLLAIGPAVGGVRQRVLVLLGCAWQASLLVVAARRSQAGATAAAQPAGRP